MDVSSDFESLPFQSDWRRREEPREQAAVGMTEAWVKS